MRIGNSSGLEDFIRNTAYNSPHSTNGMGKVGYVPKAPSLAPSCNTPRL